MSARIPVVFVSHGAPDALLKAPDTLACWREISRQIPDPKAILVVSAYWESHKPTVSLSGAPETLHDFSGFSPELYHMQYLAQGAPVLAERVSLARIDDYAIELTKNVRFMAHETIAPEINPAYDRQKQVETQSMRLYR